MKPLGRSIPELLPQVVYKPHPDRHQLYREFGLLDRYYPTRNFERLLSSIFYSISIAKPKIEVAS